MKLACLVLLFAAFTAMLAYDWLQRNRQE